MSRKFSPLSPRALAVEYLIWSLGLAAYTGTAATITILERNADGVYDPQREIVHALLSWFLTIFLLAAMPLALMALRRFIAPRARRAYVKLRCLLRGRAQQAARTASPSSPDAMPAGRGEEGERIRRTSGAKLLLEYVVVTTLVAPLFGVTVIVLLGGIDFLIPFGILFIGVLLLFDLAGFLSAVGPDVGHVIGGVAPFLFLWTIPIMIAVCPAFCVAIRLLLKLSLARVLPRK